MISSCVRTADNAASFFDKRIHYSAFLRGNYFVDFNCTDKVFLSAQCRQIDVGCGKNAEGAVQTLSRVFHNLSQKL